MHRLTNMKLLLILLAVALCSCTYFSTQTGTRSLKPSELNATQSVHANRKVVARGWLIVEPGNHNLWDDSASFERSESSHCVTVDASREDLADLAKFNRKFVVLAGTFRQDIAPEGTTMLGTCNITGIAEAELVLE